MDWWSFLWGFLCAAGIAALIGVGIWAWFMAEIVRSIMRGGR